MHIKKWIAVPTKVLRGTGKIKIKIFAWIIKTKAKAPQAIDEENKENWQKIT